jgi:hypothetical protein
MEVTSIARDARTLMATATEKILEPLTRAAEDDEEWARAASHPRAFLRENGIELPEEVEVVLEQTYVRDEPTPLGVRPDSM